jgi:shikimate kinase
MVEINLTDMEIINLGIAASMDAGVTITGALDDASASFFGGLTITNNLAGKILKKMKMEGQNILIYTPQRNSPTAQSDVGRMKLLAPWVKIAFEEAFKGNLFKALTLNGLLYCAALGFESNIALDALENGALAAGLSGTGPSFVAICEGKSIDRIEETWNSYPGKVIQTEVDNLGTRVIR